MIQSLLGNTTALYATLGVVIVLLVVLALAGYRTYRDKQEGRVAGSTMSHFFKSLTYKAPKPEVA